MAKVDTDAFFQTLDGDGAFAAVVAFGGAERVFVDDAVAAIRGRVLSGGLADFNHDRTSLRERRMPEVISMCLTLPVMAPRRLVEVRDADAANDADVEALGAHASWLHRMGRRVAAAITDDRGTAPILCTIVGEADVVGMRRSGSAPTRSAPTPMVMASTTPPKSSSPKPIRCSLTPVVTACRTISRSHLEGGVEVPGGARRHGGEHESPSA